MIGQEIEAQGNDEQHNGDTKQGMVVVAAHWCFTHLGGDGSGHSTHRPQEGTRDDRGPAGYH